MNVKVDREISFCSARVLYCPRLPAPRPPQLTQSYEAKLAKK